jgi:hypothetical protein
VGDGIKYDYRNFGYFRFIFNQLFNFKRISFIGLEQSDLHYRIWNSRWGIELVNRSSRREDELKGS